jgi:DHA1 family multidrug resistance protein-like MFS transporter
MVTGISLAFHDRHFIIFTILLIGFWFLWAQINISLPLVATAMTGTTDSVGWMYALNSGLIVVLQYPLVRILERKLQPLTILWIGMGVMSLGLALVSFATNIGIFLCCIAVYSIGGMLISPTQQTVTAERASPSAVGAYFGVNMLSLAVGGSLGNGIGSWLYDIGLSLDWPQLPWIFCGVLGIGSAIGLSMLDNVRRRGAAAQLTVKA